MNKLNSDVDDDGKKKNRQKHRNSDAKKPLLQTHIQKKTVFNC